MPRPHKCRRVRFCPDVLVVKPQGAPLRELEQVELRFDELEALRLADLEGCYQDQAAEQMGISRATFGRLLSDARRKVAEALVCGKALRIEGGNVDMPEKRRFHCNACGADFEEPFGTGRPRGCPQCGSADFCRTDAGFRHRWGGRGHGHGGGGGRCRRRGAGRRAATGGGTQASADQSEQE